ncbi:putative F-box protein [Cardamine amara subsp. amara]|uniref:F-box protein n=1 Tax=Cardamine amara subsp. amara TaxID=228776 RepID=A0ABD1BWJ9_CARAN
MEIKRRTSSLSGKIREDSKVKTCSNHRNFCSPRSCYCYRVKEEDTSIRVVGSCNGLVCVYDLVHFYLINPATRRTRRLDPPPPPPKGKIVSMGFGRDAETGTYKLVVVYSFNSGDSVEAFVFDLGTNEWRRRYETAGPIPQCLLYITVFSSYRKPRFVNGSLFWSMSRYDKGILVMDLYSHRETP